MLNPNLKFYKSYNSIKSSTRIDIYSKSILDIIIQFYSYKEKDKLNIIDKLQISINKISKSTDISRSTVIRKIQELEELELIQVVRNKNSDKINDVNTFILNEEKINEFFQDEIFIIKKDNKSTVVDHRVGKAVLPDFNNYIYK